MVSALKIHQALHIPISPWKPRPRAAFLSSSRHLVFGFALLLCLVREKVDIMAGEGGVDIDLYATVDEFEPEVAGQVRFSEKFKHGEF